MDVAKTVKLAIRILTASAIFYFCSRTFVDPDLWWHLKCGLDVLSSGQVAVPEPYSFLSFDQRWISHEWLSDCVYASVFSRAGWAGLVIFKSLMVILTLGLLLKTLVRKQADDFFIGISLLLTAIFMSPATNVVRPHIFTCLLLSLLFIILRAAEKNAKWLWLLPLMFTLWINFHGGFIVGIVTFLVWTVLQTIFAGRAVSAGGDAIPDGGSRKKVYLAWLIFALSLGALCINPYGYVLPAFIAKVAVMPRPDISEWKPIELLTSFGFLWALVAVSGIISLVVSKRKKEPVYVLMWLAFAAAPMVSVRHIQFFGIATIYLIADYLLDLWHMRPQPDAQNIGGNWRPPDLMFVCLSALMSIWLVGASFQHFVVAQAVVDQDLPQTALGIIKKIGAKGNLVVDFDWGGDAIWQLYPNVKVSFDGRREFVYSPAATMANKVFFTGLGPWDYMLKKFKVDMVLVNTNSPAFNLMKLKPGWTLVFEDEHSGLFFPSDSADCLKAKELLATIAAKDRERQLALPMF